MDLNHQEVGALKAKLGKIAIITLQSVYLCTFGLSVYCMHRAIEIALFETRSFCKSQATDDFPQKPQCMHEAEEKRKCQSCRLLSGCTNLHTGQCLAESKSPLTSDFVWFVKCPPPRPRPPTAAAGTGEAGASACSSSASGRTSYSPPS